MSGRDDRRRRFARAIAYDAARDVCALHAELPRHGLVVWTAGNVSARVPGADHFVIKPSGVGLRRPHPRLDGAVRPRRSTGRRCGRQRTFAVVRHRRARVRVPAHARRRRRRAHPLAVRDRVGRLPSTDPVRHHRDGRRVRRRDPDRPVLDHRRRVDRTCDRRHAHRAPLASGAARQPRRVHDRQGRTRRREGGGDVRGRRPHRAPRRPARHPGADRAGRRRRAVRPLPERLRTSTTQKESSDGSQHRAEPRRPRGLVPHRQPDACTATRCWPRSRPSRSSVVGHARPVDRRRRAGSCGSRCSRRATAILAADPRGQRVAERRRHHHVDAHVQPGQDVDRRALRARQADAPPAHAGQHRAAVGDHRLRLHEPQPGGSRRPRVRLHRDPPRRRPHDRGRARLRPDRHLADR